MAWGHPARPASGRGLLPSYLTADHRNDHRGGIGIFETASGYATNANAGPLLTISSTSLPDISAMKPRIEKITKPAKTDVPQLINETRRASLWQLLLNLL